jgi:amino acid transporter
MAECGSLFLFFLILGMVTFFLPLSLVAAELATALPQAGGVYNWVKKAFGHHLGFLAVWLLWIENVFWYPLVLSFIVSTLTFAFSPALIHNKLYMILSILAIIWGVTWVNLRGIQTSARLSSLGAICGTFIPSILLIAFGGLWFFHGKPFATSLSPANWLPEFSSFSELALFGGVIISLLGMEMSAVHATDVQHPQKTYPKAILFSGIFTIFFSALGVFSITMVIPKEQIISTAGCLQAFELFLEDFGLRFFLPVVAVIIALGALGSMSTWILGPCRGLIAAARSEDLPSFFKKINSQGVPKNLLITQAVLVSVLSCLFALMPTLNIAYWILITLTTQSYLVMYLLLFAAALRLRYKHPALPRPFKVPGGQLGMWLCSCLGFASSLVALLVCFIPFPQIPQDMRTSYIASLALFLLLISSVPFLVSRYRKGKATLA